MWPTPPRSCRRHESSTRPAIALLQGACEGPWGQTFARLQSPEGATIGTPYTLPCTADSHPRIQQSHLPAVADHRVATEAGPRDSPADARRETTNSDGPGQRHRRSESVPHDPPGDRLVTRRLSATALGSGGASGGWTRPHTPNCRYRATAWALSVHPFSSDPEGAPPCHRVARAGAAPDRA